MSGLAVCHSATLRCSCGTAPSSLIAQFHSAQTEAALPLATIEDSRPLLNVQPFGNCTSDSNPNAFFGPPPCVPHTASMWQQLVPSVRYQQVSALRSDATLLCQYGGVISVVAAGQSTTTLREQGS